MVKEIKDFHVPLVLWRVEVVDPNDDTHHKLFLVRAVTANDAATIITDPLYGFDGINPPLIFGTIVLANRGDVQQ